MKKNVNKISSEFEKLLSEELQNKWENKPKSQDNESHDNSKNKKDEKDGDSNKHEFNNDDTNKKIDNKTSGDDKK